MNDNPESSTGQAPESQVSAPAAHAAPPASAPTTSSAPSGGGMVSQDDKTQATLVWVLSLFFGFIPSLIFFLIAKEKPFVHRHATEALALTIITAVGYFASMILMAVLIGLLVLPIVGIFHLVICIMGAIAANKGEEYNPPIASALAKSLFHV